MTDFYSTLSPCYLRVSSYCLGIYFPSIKQTERDKFARRKDDFGAATQIMKLNMVVLYFVFSATKRPERVSNKDHLPKWKISGRRKGFVSELRRAPPSTIRKRCSVTGGEAPPATGSLSSTLSSGVHPIVCVCPNLLSPFLPVLRFFLFFFCSSSAIPVSSRQPSRKIKCILKGTFGAGRFG